MTDYTKPEVLPAWGENNQSPADMIQPTEAEIGAGWPLTSIPPSRQRFNWVLHWASNGMRYIMQRGLVAWDAEENYTAGARVIGDDGKTYKALTTNINQPPSTNADDWELWALSLSDLTAKFVELTGLTGSAKLPNGTTAQRDASPSQGYARYNSTLDRAEVFSTAKGWTAMGGGATGGSLDEIFYLNNTHITANYTVPANKNAGTFGPVIVDDGVVVTVSDGSTWSVV